MDFLTKIFMKLLTDNKKRKRWRFFTTALAGIVVFTTSYMLILPAITMNAVVAEETPGVYLTDDIPGDEGADDDVWYDELTEGDSFDDDFEDEAGFVDETADDWTDEEAADAYVDDTGNGDIEDVVSDGVDADGDGESDAGVDDGNDEGSNEGSVTSISDEQIFVNGDESKEVTYTITELNASITDDQDPTQNVDVRLAFDTSAEIPDGTELYAEEIKKNSADAQTYDGYAGATDEALRLEEDDWALLDARFFSLRLENSASGLLVEPAASVTVELTFAEPICADRLRLVRFNDYEEAALPVSIRDFHTDANTDGGVYRVSFATETFSVFGVVMGEAAEVAAGEDVVESVAGPLTESGVDSEAESAVEPMTESFDDSVAESVVESVTGSIAGSVAESAVEPMTESIDDSVAKPVVESVIEDIVDSVAESVAEAATESVADSVEEPAVESIAESVVDSVAESVVEPVTENVADSEAESAVEPMTESADDSVAEPVAEAATENIADSVEEPVVESTTESVVESLIESTEEIVDSVVESMVESVEESDEGITASTTDSNSESTPSAEQQDATENTTGENNPELFYPEQRFSRSTSNVRVQVYAEEGAFPEGTTMTVDPVDDEDTMSAITDAAEEESEAKVRRIHAVDISFWYNNEKIEPLRPIRVEMTADEIRENEKAMVVHVDDSGNAETLSDVETVLKEETAITAETGDENHVAIAPEEPQAADTVVFEAEKFSVYAIVYTVDFSYSVNGQMYDFSLPGGEKIRLSELIEVLGVIEGTQFDSVSKFIEHVSDVGFSDRSLVKVAPVKEGGLLGIGAKTVDWELESLQLFDTEETLTITMKNGDMITVKVTDAQITKDILTASGETYTITVEYGDDAEIPDNSDLNVTEITESSDYNKYLSDSASQLGVEDKDVTFARFFDIEIVDENGKKVEPKTPVQVKIVYKDAVDTSAFLHVVHFAEDGTEVIDNVMLSEDNKEITYEQGSFSVTGTVLTTAPTNGSAYMVIVKHGTNYYLVQNNGTLIPVDYNTSTNEASVDYPMMWTYTGSNLYHDSNAVDFDSSQVASDYYYRYLDPSAVSGVSEDTADNTQQYDSGNGKKITDGSRQMMSHSALSYSNHRVKSNNCEYYLGVIEENGELKLAGGLDASKASDIYFATPSSKLSLLENNHTVSHIDVSIEGASSIDVPLAYGKYYDAEGNVLLDVTSNKTLHLTKDKIAVTKEDMKNASIRAYVKNSDGTTTEIDDAFYITGYSANKETDYSSDQVRIEGSFKVANLEPFVPDYWSYKYTANGDPTWRKNRLDNRIYYEIAAVKSVTFDLVDDKGRQLYDDTGEKLTVTADMTFSASFDYWDTRNECPPLQKDSGWYQYDNWQAGDIPFSISGMDFVLGGAGDKADAKIVAVEITKIIVDENGNRIKTNDTVKNTFYVYRNDTATSDSVKDLNIGRATETPDYTGYVRQHSKSLTVGDSGLGLVYDYDVTPGMYYISEDPSSIKDKITDTSGQEWDYKETYFLTEYAWRNHNNDNFMHVSETYSGKTGSYSSVPEILGNHPSYDGTEEFTNDFLEFYVYNVYESPKVDVPVIKAWPAFESDEYDWTAAFRLQWAPLYPDESTPSVSFQDVTPQQTVTVTKAKMEGLTQDLVNRYLAGDETLTAAEISKVEAVTFKNLPKYGTDAQGNTYRIQYSLEEIAYSVTDSASGVVQYSWDEDNGYNTGDEESHYLPFYIHDAGETISSNTDDQNEADANYYVQVTNATKQIREKEYINVNLDKQWDLNNDGTMDTRDDTYWAEFELKRYVRTEYRDLSQMSDSDRTADPITITIKDGDTVVHTLQVQPNVGLYLAGNFMPHDAAKSVTFTADKAVRTANGSRMTSIIASVDGSNMSNALVRSREFFVTEDTTFQIGSGKENLVSGNLAQVMDTSAGTSPVLDKTFSQTIRLDSENGWHAALENLIKSETSTGEDDDNETVAYYEYYLVEKESNPEGYAQYFLANGGALTETLSGDADHRIDTTSSVIAVNGPTNRLIVKKVWRGVPDATGFPGVTFTLYQTWTDDQNGNGWVYENEKGEKYEKVELKGQSLEWICPEVLPTSKLDNGTSRAVKYYVVEDVRSGSYTEGNITVGWQFFYYLNSKGTQTNAGHQGHNVALTGADLASDGGTITICNKMDAYMQLDIQKQFFELKDAGSWDNTTGTTARMRSTVLGFKVIRAIKTSDGKWLDDKGNEVDNPVWMDYSSELLCGFDENGNQITDSGEENFWLHGAGGDWAFRIEDNQGDANDVKAGGTGLPKYGFFIRNGEDIPVEYYYSYRETNVYKDLNRTPYDNWEWFSSITPVNAYGAGGSFEAFDKAFHGQDGTRVANFQASDLFIDKQWIGDVAVSEVYVKIWRVSGDEAPEDFTAVIADDIRYNNNWQMYVRDTSTVDVYRKALILKDDGSGNWTTALTVNRALLGSLAETGKYSYYIQEVGYKTLDGQYKTNVNAKFKPLYSHWDGDAYSTGSNDYVGNAITIKEKGQNKLRVTNRSTPATSYTVSKSFAGTQTSTSGSTSVTNRYPTDGSKQVVVELQQRYRIEKTVADQLYVLKKGGDSENESDWIAVTEGNAEAVEAAWLVDWQGAESASPVSVALPRTKPTGSSLTDEQWYGSAAAWSYTWEGLDVVKVLADDADPDKKVSAQLYYRGVETSTPEWMNKFISEEDQQGHKAIDDDGQTSAEIRSESNGVTNRQGDMTLSLNKEWTGLGAGVEWPEGYVVHYQVVQNYHLTGADVSKTKTEGGLTYIDPEFSYDARVIKSVDMTSTNQTGVDADKYHPQADKTLEESNHNLTLSGLPMYGFFTATEEDVTEAAKVGVTLQAGVTYPVVYTYSVRETKVTKDGVEVGFKAQTVEAERDRSVTDKVQYNATLSNELTSVTVRKDWNGLNHTPGSDESATIKLYRFEKDAEPIPETTFKYTVNVTGNSDALNSDGTVTVKIYDSENQEVGSYTLKKNDWSHEFNLEIGGTYHATFEGDGTVLNSAVTPATAANITEESSIDLTATVKPAVTTTSATIRLIGTPSSAVLVYGICDNSGQKIRNSSGQELAWSPNSLSSAGTMTIDGLTVGETYKFYLQNGTSSLQKIEGGTEAYNWVTFTAQAGSNEIVLTAKESGGGGGGGTSSFGGVNIPSDKISNQWGSITYTNPLQIGTEYDYWIQVHDIGTFANYSVDVQGGTYRIGTVNDYGTGGQLQLYITPTDSNVSVNITFPAGARGRNPAPARTTSKAPAKAPASITWTNDKSTLPAGANPSSDTLVDTVTFSGSTWSKTWDELPKYSENGKEYVYYAYETDFAGASGATTMTTTYSNEDGTLVVTNTPTYPGLGNLKVQKEVYYSGALNTEANGQSFTVGLFTDADGTTRVTGVEDQTISITDGKGETTFAGLQPGTYYVFEVVNGNAVTASGTKATIDGIEYTVTYSSANETTVSGGSTVTFSLVNEKAPFTLNILKVDANISTKTLDGAKFAIQPVKEEIPSTGRPSYVDGSSATEKTTTSGGTLSFDNLASGYYEVKETHMPDGYVISGESNFYIHVDGEGISLVKVKAEVDPEEGTVYTWEEGTTNSNVTLEATTATVKNEPGVALPSTGGSVTTLFTILGSILVLGAGFLLWRRRRLI